MLEKLMHGIMFTITILASSWRCGYKRSTRLHGLSCGLEGRSKTALLLVIHLLLVVSRSI